MTPTNNWITDRRPTEADGDSDGDVLARCHPDSDGHCYLHWSHVGEATPWMHWSRWQPPALPPLPAQYFQPSQPTTPALAAGQRWRRRDGEVVRIFRRGRFFCADRFNYNVDGTAPFSTGPRPELDLIELFTPTTTPRRFVSVTRTITTLGHVIDAIDEDGVAWWMITSPDGPEPEWHQLTPLPGREVVG